MGAPTPGYANRDEKNWALIAHFGGAVGAFIGLGCGGWIAPTVALYGKGNESATTRAHAVAALNFQLLVTLTAVVGWVLTCVGIGYVIVAIAVIAGVLLGVLGGLKANEGELYRYPLPVNLVK